MMQRSALPRVLCTLIGAAALASFAACGAEGDSRGVPRGAPGTGVAPPGSCDRVAAPDGDDANPGDVKRPLRSAQALVNSLGSGQTGCFRAGLYDGDDSINVSRPGVTLTSYPGERATLKGLLKVEAGGDGVSVSDLDIDGRNSHDFGPIVFGSDVTFDNVDVTNHNTGICFILGASDLPAGRAVNTVIENSRIHDCGRLPARNGDHGVYVAHSDGAVIRNNWIYDNADRGIQLYPDSQGTRVYGNVIDGNGEGVIFSGNEETASSNNIVEDNVISNSKLRWNVESLWVGDLVGTGNVLRANCLWATNPDQAYRARGGVLGPSGDSPRGFSAADNTIADPGFADAQRADYRLASGGTCVAVLGAARSPAASSAAR